MTPCLPWPRTDKTLHSDSPLTPTPLPARVPAPWRHRGVSPHPPPMRSCSVGVGRGFCKVIVQTRVTGRTGSSLTPPLSHVGDRPAFRTESPVSRETSRSLRVGVVVCPAEEPPRISFSHGAIQISLPSQNEQAAQSFQTCPLKTLQNLMCGKPFFSAEDQRVPPPDTRQPPGSLLGGGLGRLRGGRFRLEPRLTSSQS